MQLSKLATVSWTKAAPAGTATSTPIVPWNSPVCTAGTGFKMFPMISSTLYTLAAIGMAPLIVIVLPEVRQVKFVAAIPETVTDRQVGEARV